MLSEKNGYSKQKHIPLENVKGNIKSDSLETIQFNISSDEMLYGGGARALGMNRRGNKLALIQPSRLWLRNPFRVDEFHHSNGFVIENICRSF